MKCNGLQRLVTRLGKIQLPHQRWRKIFACSRPSRHGPDFHRPESQITIDTPDFHLRRSQNCLLGMVKGVRSGAGQWRKKVTQPPFLLEKVTYGLQRLGTRLVKIQLSHQRWRKIFMCSRWSKECGQVQVNGERKLLNPPFC